MEKLFIPYIGSDRAGLGDPVKCPNGLKDIVDFYKDYRGLVGISINRHPMFLSENDDTIFHLVLDKDETILGLCNFLEGRLSHTPWSTLISREHARVINRICLDMDDAILRHFKERATSAE